ncbi:MAG: hypothetical protein H0W20_04350 [Chthoniobacterales bacterium]|nr:hypothetical protein [Chthoniobacterales bacterium]
MNPTADPPSLAQWNALVWLLSHVTAADTSLLPIAQPGSGPDDQQFRRVQQQADELARRASEANLGRDFALRVLARLAALDEEFAPATGTPHEILFRRAQRLVLAIERLTVANLPPAQQNLPSSGLTSLRDNLRSPAAFDPERFANLLTEFRISVGDPVP